MIGLRFSLHLAAFTLYRMVMIMDDILTPKYFAAGSIAFPDWCVSRITLSYAHNLEDAVCGYLGQPHTQPSHQLPAHVLAPDSSQPYLVLPLGYHSHTPLKPHAPTPKDNSHSSHYYLYASSSGVDPTPPLYAKKGKLFHGGINCKRENPRKRKKKPDFPV